MSLASTLIRGSAVSLLDHFVKIAVVFVTTPLMVRHLGEHDYGVWIIALTIVGYLRLLDLGLSLAGNRFLGHAIGTGEPQRFHDLFLAFSYLFNRIGLASALITVLLVLGSPFLVPEQEGGRDARLILLGLGLATSLRFWTQIYTLVLKSHLRYDWIGMASILKTFVQGTLLVVLLSTGHGLHSLLAAYVFTDLLDQFAHFLLARRTYPEARFLFVRRRPEGLGPILRYSGTTILASVGNQLRNGIDPLVVGHFSGLSMVPVYAIGSRFLTLFTDLVNAVFGGNFLAAFSQLDGRNDREALVRNFLTSLRFSSALAAAGGGFLALFGPSFIERWMGPEFAQSGKVLLILAFPTTLMLIQYPVGNLLYSQNRQHWLAFAGLGGGLFNAILSITLVLHFGFLGVVWATFVEVILHFGMVVPVIAAKSCDLSLVTYFSRIVRQAFPYAFLAGICYISAGSLVTPDYGRLALLGGAFGLLLLPVFWFTTLNRDERSRLRRLMPWSPNHDPH